MRLHKFVNEDFLPEFRDDLDFLIRAFKKNFDEKKIDSDIEEYNSLDLRIQTYKRGMGNGFSIVLYHYLLGNPFNEAKAVCNEILARQKLLIEELSKYNLDSGSKADLCDQQKISLFILYSIVNGFTDADRKQFAEGTPAGIDRCMDRLLQRYQPEREIGENTLDPRMFKYLYNVFDAAPEQRPALIKDFLANWETRIKKGYHPYMNWGSHEDPNSNFAGYWCFPAAAVVATLNIDDSTFIDDEYYPADLMREVAKQRGEPVILPPLTNSVPPLPEPPETVPAERPWPEDLQPYSRLTELICKPLPESLRIAMRNALVEVVDDEDNEVSRPLEWAEYLYCLSQAQGDIELNRDYKRCVLLHIDWKDVDSALFFAQQLARTSGLPEFDTEQAVTVPDVLDAFRSWISAQGWDLYLPQTGGDNYMAYIAPQTARSQYEKELVELDQPFYRSDSEEVSQNYFKLFCKVIEQGNDAITGLDNDPLRVASALMLGAIHYTTFAYVGNEKYMQEAEINLVVEQFRKRLQEYQSERKKKFEQGGPQE